MSDSDPRRAFFDRLAPTWEEEGPPIPTMLERLEGLRDELPLRSGARLLEVGGGTGGITNWLADAVAPGPVTSVDFSPAMISAARQRGARSELVCADVCAGLPWDNAFDVAWCMHVFPHFRDQPTALHHLAASLAPGGTLVILHLDSWANINAFHAQLEGVVSTDLLPEPSQWDAMLVQAGLRPQQLVDRDDLLLVTAVKQTR